ncbi:unnamed protein product [Acanthoscelides obtectus]|uniref:Transposase n=1 Tax=Acanthoscelides obtectus TaxID=200917 RepID=A0A9P0K1Q1_ACAOB|nr:unnamed protein product [Acanthoscelides obtectus]CAK1658703.1 Histone-lysine N-methyltransferase SETMAR [Acanthoscelides obtectus]
MNSNVHRKYVLELVAKYRETGSVDNKKRNIENPIRNEAIEVGVLGQVYVDPTLSTRKLETVCGVTRRTVQRILKAHSFHPYKIHLVQELNEDDFDRRLQFCEDMIIRKMELNREHLRAIIYYNFQRQLSQQECLAELLLSDDPRVGAPKTAVTQENVDAVRKLIIEDRRVSYREIEASLKNSKTSIQTILHEELGVRKLVSSWIPHLSTEEQKAARVNWCQKKLVGNSKNVYSIVSGDESWIYCYEPENKRQSAVWVVATFLSKACHIATIPLNEQRTVTADWYTTICLPKVITELRKINPERRIILHQYNASSHTAQKTRQYLTEENVELLDHPPYSPDLSPNDFFTFPKIKNRLRGQRFQSPEEAVDAFKNAVLDLPANEWNKCFEAHADNKASGTSRTGRYDRSFWCRQRSLWDQEWNSIVFSDESRFCLGMHDGRARVRRRRGESRNPQFFVERHVHHTVGVMVWGAIAYDSRSPLIFIRGNMNAQHNARPHVARVTIDFFQHNDISPIEHVLDMMGRRLLNLQRHPQTLEALREELVVAWNELPQEDIDHLIRSMPRRVGECVAHQGASTHY